MTGRPSEFTQAVADTICERLAGGESVVDIARDKAMPCQTTIYKWLNVHPSFAEKYARARIVQADVLFDEIIAIADTPEVGIKTVTKATGIETTEGDMIEHRRLRVDARKWVASKLAPKKYGEKQEVEVHGPGGGAIPITVSMTPKEAAEAYASTVNADEG